VGEDGATVIDDVTGQRVTVCRLRRCDGAAVDLCQPADPDASLPHHPELGESMPARFNVKLFDPDREFEYSRVAAQEENLHEWHQALGSSGQLRVTVLEIGAGLHVPTVRNKVFGRGPSFNRGFLAHNGVLGEKGALVRINLEHSALQEEDERRLAAEGRAVSLAMGALGALTRIGAALSAARSAG